MKFGLCLLGFLLVSLYGVAQEKDLATAAMELAAMEPVDVLLGMIQDKARQLHYPEGLQQEYASFQTREEVENLLNSVTSGRHGATIKEFLRTEAGVELLGKMPAIQSGMCTIYHNALRRGYGEYRKSDPMNAVLLEEAGFLNDHCK